ncbi:hypothetical protein WJX72_004454 [[Myrmecia] bisecta]|uniref:Kinesin-like protein n=1 Tax=[Myrmecia] bisecta TaxID=41462 RepID=A0AAW1Q754_9CHLO
MELEQGCKEVVRAVPSQPGKVQVLNRFYDFDKAFGAEGQDLSELYAETAQPLVDGLFEGYNSTVFAYGQTGSGKTYTMGTGAPGVKDEDLASGAASASTWEHAIVTQVMAGVFQHVQAIRAQGKGAVQVSCAFCEVYMNDVYDLQPSGIGRTSADRPNKRAITTIEALKHTDVDTVEQLRDQMAICIKERATGATKMNKESSRSHAIFTIRVEQRRKVNALTADFTASSGPAAPDDNDEVLTGRINLADLAGAERLDRSGAVGTQVKEASSINMGLMVLGRVIAALASTATQRPHVPYNDHPLTRLLRDAIGGNSRTVMIACISPADSNLSETINTLDYATDARKVKNVPVRNANKIKLLQEENEALRRQLEELAEKLVAAEERFTGCVALEDFAKQKEELEGERLRASLAEADCESLEEKLNAALEDLDEIRSLQEAAAAALQDQRSSPLGASPLLDDEAAAGDLMLEHEQHLLSRKRRDAQEVEAALQHLPGSILSSQPGQTLNSGRQGGAIQAAILRLTQGPQLERILEGEIAQRADLGKQLAAVDRQLLALDGSPGKEADREALERRRAELAARVQQHSTKIEALQVKKMELRDLRVDSVVHELGPGAGPELLQSVLANAVDQRLEALQYQAELVDKEDALVYKDKLLMVLNSELSQKLQEVERLRAELALVSETRSTVEAQLAQAAEEKVEVVKKLGEAEDRVFALRQQLVEQSAKAKELTAQLLGPARVGFAGTPTRKSRLMMSPGPSQLHMAPRSSSESSGSPGTPGAATLVSSPSARDPLFSPEELSDAVADKMAWVEKASGLSTEKWKLEGKVKELQAKVNRVEAERDHLQAQASLCSTPRASIDASHLRGSEAGETAASGLTTPRRGSMSFLSSPFALLGLSERLSNPTFATAASAERSKASDSPSAASSRRVSTGRPGSAFGAALDAAAQQIRRTCSLAGIPGPILVRPGPGPDPTAPYGLYDPVLDLMQPDGSSRGTKCSLQDWLAKLGIGQDWRQCVHIVGAQLLLADWLQRHAVKSGACWFCCKDAPGEADSTCHPEFAEFAMCEACASELNANAPFSSWGDSDWLDEDGLDEYCRICAGFAAGHTEKLFICDVDGCGNAFCGGCLWRFTADDLSKLKDTHWQCPCCRPGYLLEPRLFEAAGPAIGRSREADGMISPETSQGHPLGGEPSSEGAVSNESMQRAQPFSDPSRPSSRASIASSTGDRGSSVQPRGAGATAGAAPARSRSSRSSNEDAGQPQDAPRRQRGGSTASVGYMTSMTARKKVAQAAVDDSSDEDFIKPAPRRFLKKPAANSGALPACGRASQHAELDTSHGKRTAKGPNRQ